jgi:hypothetical protein
LSLTLTGKPKPNHIRRLQHQPTSNLFPISVCPTNNHCSPLSSFFFVPLGP